MNNEGGNLNPYVGRRSKSFNPYHSSVLLDSNDAYEINEITEMMETERSRMERIRGANAELEERIGQLTQVIDGQKETIERQEGEIDNLQGEVSEWKMKARHYEETMNSPDDTESSSGNKYLERMMEKKNAVQKDLNELKRRNRMIEREKKELEEILEKERNDPSRPGPVDDRLVVKLRNGKENERLENERLKFELSGMKTRIEHLTKTLEIKERRQRIQLEKIRKKLVEEKEKNRKKISSSSSVVTEESYVGESDSLPTIQAATSSLELEDTTKAHVGGGDDDVSDDDMVSITTTTTTTQAMSNVQPDNIMEFDDILYDWIDNDVDPMHFFSVDRIVIEQMGKVGCLYGCMAFFFVFCSLPLVLISPPLSVFFTQYVSGFARSSDGLNCEENVRRFFTHPKILYSAMLTSLFYVPGVVYALVHYMLVMWLWMTYFICCCGRGLTNLPTKGDIRSGYEKIAGDDNDEFYGEL